jgi:hypothetical protein
MAKQHSANAKVLNGETINHGTISEIHCSKSTWPND